MHIESAAVINLASRPDRLRAFMDRWDDNELHVNVHTANGPHKYMTRYKISRHDAAMLDCTHMHKHILSLYRGPLLVMEDDAVIPTHFWTAIDDLDIDTIHPQWDIIQLGGRHLTGPIRMSHGDLVRCLDTDLTHAYIVRDPADIARQIRPNTMQSIDDQFNQMNLYRYAPREWLVGQAAGQSDIRNQYVGAKGL